MNALGHVPKRDESIIINELNFKILRSSDRRVDLLEVSPAEIISEDMATESADVEHD